MGWALVALVGTKLGAGDPTREAHRLTRTALGLVIRLHRRMFPSAWVRLFRLAVLNAGTLYLRPVGRSLRSSAQSIALYFAS
jgi:hypothetical protein